ncbi:MAG: sulfur carrier protein ThiS adenylyltransferase ThiF [Candidatus Omnitrophota bacterium]|jgi:sulfur carrier protein ThiS adenylyltransferase
MAKFIELLRAGLGKDYAGKAGSIRVAIAGCGGLGSNCAFNLVRAGITRLRLIDFDLVERSNLNRQFFFYAQVGMSKPDALAQNLMAINPGLELDIVKKKIDAENIKDILDGCQVVVEALDSVSEKVMIAEALLGEGKFIVSASGIAGMGNTDRIRVHRVKENFVLIGDLETGAEDAPVLSPAVNIAAAKQADIVIEYIMKK